VPNPLQLFMRVPVPWVFVLAYLAGAGLESRHRQALSPEVTRLAMLGGWVLFAAGAAMAGWCLLLFRRARTTTVPGQAPAQLVTSGPYRFTRNPMYVSLTLAYLGEAGLLRQSWPVILLPLVLAYLHWTVIPVEEARLTEVFPAQYAEYRSRVRRWI